MLSIHVHVCCTCMLLWISLYVCMQYSLSKACEYIIFVTHTYYYFRNIESTICTWQALQIFEGVPVPYLISLLFIQSTHVLVAHANLCSPMNSANLTLGHLLIMPSWASSSYSDSIVLSGVRSFSFLPFFPFLPFFYKDANMQVHNIHTMYVDMSVNPPLSSLSFPSSLCPSFLCLCLSQQPAVEYNKKVT